MKLALCLVFAAPLLACGSTVITSATSSGASGTAGSTGRFNSGSATSTGSPGASSSTTGNNGSGTSGGVQPGADGGLCLLTDGGVYLDGGGVPDFQECYSNADCLCPELCANDPTIYSTILGAGSGLICTFPCQTTADCPDPQTSCQGGACLTAICAADGGPYYGPCDAAGKGDGTCVPAIDDNGNQFGECLQSGSATTSCNPLATRLSGGPLCVPGTVCAQALDGGLDGVCQPQCDPLAAVSSCDAEQVCSGAQNASGETLFVAGNTPHSGQCYPAGPSGCALDLPFTAATELMPCSDNAGCGCPETCVLDPGQNATVCELPCANTASDCPTTSTACIEGHCRQNYCDTDLTGAAVAGSFDQRCNASTDGGDGTCEAQVETDQGFLVLQYAYGVCVQGGALAPAASGGCDESATLRDAGATLCTVGSECLQYDANGDTACLPLCDPTRFSAAQADAGMDGGECAPGQGCFGLWSDEYPGVAVSYGACAACTGSGGTCGTASECCATLACADAGPDNGYLCQ